MIKSEICIVEFTKSKVGFQPTTDYKLTKAHDTDTSANSKEKQEGHIPVRSIVNNAIERGNISFRLIFGIAAKNLKWGR